MCRIQLDVTKELQWKRCDTLTRRYITNLVTQTLEVMGLKKNITYILSVYYANDQIIQVYNNNYRKKNKPTNVLSFGQVATAEHGHEIINKNISKMFYLGEVVLAFETINNEALAEGKSTKEHTKHLLVHSILHLLGYDHENEEDAQVMEALEEKILTVLQNTGD